MVVGGNFFEAIQTIATSAAISIAATQQQAHLTIVRRDHQRETH